MAAQDIHGVWYAAQVLETGKLGYYVHYLGWEDWWDEWLEESRVMKAEGIPQAAPVLSEESLAADRVRSLESNDLWQFDSFQKTFQGSIRGTSESIYKGQSDKKSVTMSFERCDGDGERAHESFAIGVREDGDSAWPLNVRLVPGDFRGDSFRSLEGGELGGTAANVNAFSTARFCQSAGGEKSSFALVNDLWLRKGSSFLGLRVSYREAQSDSVAQSWMLDSARLFRLGDEQSLLDFGTGLVDPHPLTKDNIVVSSEDRVTCAFPETINKDSPGVVRAYVCGMRSVTCPLVLLLFLICSCCSIIFRSHSASFLRRYR